MEGGKFRDWTGKYTHRGPLEHRKVVRRALATEHRLVVWHWGPQIHFLQLSIDALAEYNHLINGVGFNPVHIILVGDSAGGNLALTLTRYLVESHRIDETNVPFPPDNLLFSFRADTSDSHNTPGSQGEPTAPRISSLIQGLRSSTTPAKWATQNVLLGSISICVLCGSHPCCRTDGVVCLLPNDIHSPLLAFPILISMYWREVLFP